MLSNSLNIITATVKDAAQLTELSVKTFRDTFDAHNKREDMDAYLANDMSLARITEELNDSENTFFLAYDNNILKGYAKIRATQIPEQLKNNNPLEIERIYVLHEYHSSKVGAALMQHCIDFAINKQCDIIWLGVWEHNHKAVNFYKKWGFELFGDHPFLLGSDLQTDVLMKKEL